MKKGLFGSHWGNIHISKRGWILGKFKGEYNDGGSYGGADVVEDYLTALLDLSQDDQLYRNSPKLSYNPGLIRVRRLWGGYELVGSGRLVSDWQSGQGWKEVAQAIKRLTGESS